MSLQIPHADSESLPLYFVINKSAGGVRAQRTALDALMEASIEAGHRVEELSLEPEELDGIAGQLPQDACMVIICGGDGTVRSCFQNLADTEHSLAVMPLGTVNVFARSLGLSMDLEEALVQLLEGREEKLDAASVNGKLFLNTCILGLYPRLSSLREERRARHAHWPKFLRWLVDSATSAASVLASWRRLRFVIDVEGEYLVGKAVTFAVTNNERSVPPGPARLDRSELVAYLPRPVTRMGLLRLVLRALFVDQEELEPLAVKRTTALRIHVPDGTPMSLDGEIGEVEGDLDIHCLPKHCRVRVPMAAGSNS